MNTYKWTAKGKTREGIKISAQGDAQANDATEAADQVVKIVQEDLGWTPDQVKVHEQRLPKRRVVSSGVRRDKPQQGPSGNRADKA